MNRNKLLQWLTIITLITLVALIGGCSTSPFQKKELPTPTPLPTLATLSKATYVVERGNIDEILEFTGRIVPVEQTELFFRVSGRVRKVYVAEGDDVKAGQLMADLDSVDNLERDQTSRQLNLRRAQIYVDIAQKALDELEKNAPQQVANDQQALARAQQAIADAQKAVEKAQKARDAMNSQKVTDPTIVEKAQANYLLAKKAYEDALKAYNQVANRKLTDPERVNALNNLVNAKAALDRALATYNWYLLPYSAEDKAQAEADLAVAQANLAQAQATYDSLKSGASADSKLEDAKRQLELAQIGLEEAQLGVQDSSKAIADASIVAPADGRVMDFNLQEGQTVEAFKTMAIVADINQLEISADPKNEILEKLEEGMKVKAFSGSLVDKDFTGVIRRLPYNVGSLDLSTSVQDKTVRITLDVSPVEAGLKIGFLMNISVLLQHKEDVLLIPAQALRFFEGRNFVLVKNGALTQRVDVEVGIETDTLVEILEGLSEGQVVVAP